MDGLSVVSIAKSYDKRTVLTDVSVSVGRGEVVGLLGPNGAGKTTCFYSVMGLVKPDSGRIVLDGDDITGLPMYRRVRLGQFEDGQDVLLDRQPPKDRGFLRQIAEPEDRAAVHRQAGDVVAVEHDPARIGLHEAHHRIEAGRLARAVRTEQPDHLAAPDRHRDVAEHDALVVALGDRDDLEAVHDRRLVDRLRRL